MVNRSLSATVGALLGPDLLFLGIDLNWPTGVISSGDEKSQPGHQPPGQENCRQHADNLDYLLPSRHDPRPLILAA